MCMVDPEDLRVPVWVGVGTGLGRPKHDMATSAGVYCITIATDVVCGVVDRKLFCRKYGVVDNSNRIGLLIGEETGIIAIEAFP